MLYRKAHLVFEIFITDRQLSRRFIVQSVHKVKMDKKKNNRLLNQKYIFLFNIIALDY